jgi:putative cell wall-binding protein
VTGIDDAQLVWSSSNPSVATVDETGKVTALRKGVTTVSAALDGVSYNCAVTVKVRYSELYGQDRYGTARSAVLSSYLPQGSDGVIITSGGDANFPDALAASSLSGLFDYPILIASNAGITSGMLKDIDTLKGVRDDFKVMIVGGSSAVGATIESQLSAYYGEINIIRIAGDDRYQTAMDIYVYGLAQNGWADTAILCLGTRFPDALSVSPYAFASRSPIFLVRDDGVLDSEQLAALTSGAFNRVLVVGGTAAIPDSALTPLSSLTVVRQGGADRYQTSALLADWCASTGTLNWNSVGFSTGIKFPDALTGGPIQGRLSGLMVLVDPVGTGSGDGAAILPTLSAKDIRRVNFYGGTEALSTQFKSDIKTAIG